METRIKTKIKELGKALKNLEQAMGIKLNLFPGIVKDSVESGQIQKFEFSCELLWKVIKGFLYEIEGVNVKTPKSTIKEFFSAGYVNYEEYESAIQMIDDRNMLSHIYKAEMLKGIHKRLKAHLVLMKKILKIMQDRIIVKEDK